MTGSLRRKVIETSERALRRGALQPIATRVQRLEDGGVRFLVRIVEQPARKRQGPVEATSPPPRANPFLPYDETLFVQDISDSHVGLLNKFNVVRHHLLVVTRCFEDQQALLNEADFDALWRCLLQYDSLGFYNSGSVAGASQPHKHLQVVPLPLSPEGGDVPLAPLIRETFGGTARRPRPSRLLRHAVRPVESGWLSSPEQAARQSQAAYLQLLGQCGCWTSRAENPRPYNLLVTRDWMMLVPRRRERFRSMSINALGFAGALLAHTAEQFETLRRRGPMAALQYVASSS